MAIISDDKIVGILNGGSDIFPLAAAGLDAAGSDGSAAVCPSAATGSALPDVHAHAPCDQARADTWQRPLTPIRANPDGLILDTQEGAIPPHVSPGGGWRALLRGQDLLCCPPCMARWTQ